MINYRLIINLTYAIPGAMIQFQGDSQLTHLLIWL